MFNPVLLMATLIFTSPTFAEEREVANDKSASQDIVSLELSARSFFEPKTEADVNALATLSRELESSLGQETLN